MKSLLHSEPECHVSMRRSSSFLLLLRFALIVLYLSLTNKNDDAAHAANGVEVEDLGRDHTFPSWRQNIVEVVSLI